MTKGAFPNLAVETLYLNRHYDRINGARVGPFRQILKDKPIHSAYWKSAEVVLFFCFVFVVVVVVVVFLILIIVFIVFYCSFFI